MLTVVMPVLSRFFPLEVDVCSPLLLHGKYPRKYSFDRLFWGFRVVYIHYIRNI